MTKATFAAGCFWGVEAAFRQFDGVLSTRVGYTGGQAERPSYEEVCSGLTGHAEAVEVRFDPSKTNFGDLLDLFWQVHDPTQANRQGPDVGHQYRSVIFYHDDDQRNEAIAAKIKLERSGRLKHIVATEILPAAAFWEAEAYHQQYLEKTGQYACGSQGEA